MIEIRLAEAAPASATGARERLGKTSIARRILLKRPLLQALTRDALRRCC